MSKREEDEEGFLWGLLAVFLLFSALLSFVVILFHTIPTYVLDAWPGWFGVQFREDTNWRVPPILFSITFAPPAFLIYLSTVCMHKYEYLNSEVTHQRNINRLKKARESLKEGLHSLDVIEHQYEEKLQLLRTIEDQLESIKTTKDIGTSDLNSILNAVNLTHRNRKWFQILLGIVVGFIASLAANFVYNLV